MPQASRLPPIDVPDVDLPTFLLEHTRTNSIYGQMPSLPMLTDENMSLTFAQLEQLAVSFASGLVNRLGFRRDDVLAIVLPNTVFYPAVVLGTQMAGGTVATANPAYTSRELAHQLRLTEAKFVVTAQEKVPTVHEALRISSMAISHERILTIDGTRNNIRRILAAKPFDRVRLTTYEQAKDTPAFIIFSSGTSGQPKGVVLTHRNMVANVLQNIEFDRADGVIRDADKRIPHQAWMCVLPMFHSYGLTEIMLAGIAKGAHLIMMNGFQIRRFCELAQKYRASVAHLVPPILLQIAKNPIVSQYDLSHFVYVNSAAAPLSKELQNEAQQRLGAPVLQGYGLSETSPMSHRSQVASSVAGSVGLLLSCMETKIIDDSGKELEVGQSGEVCMKGPNIMKGYLKNPQATAEAIDEDGFLHTGDIGHVDANGYYFITDRKKELIKYKGFQVAPAELEGLLTDHPAVIDSAVIPVYDESRASEIPKAFVVIRPEKNVPGIADGVRAWVDSKVAGYKRLRGGVEIVDAIPKSATGKILRRVLRERESKKRTMNAKL